MKVWPLLALASLVGSGCATLLGIDDTVIGDAAVDTDGGDGGPTDGGGPDAPLACTTGIPGTAGGQIKEAREHVGAADVTIDGAFVTYVAPPVLGDVSVVKLWLQEATAGPGLALQVSPSQLGTVPAVGDRVRFRALALSAADTPRVVEKIADWTVLARGCPTFFAETVTPNQITDRAPEYDGRLIATMGFAQTALVTSPRGLVSTLIGSGPDPGETTLFMLDTVADALDFQAGCTLAMRVPVLSSRGKAAVYAYRTDDVTVTGCPGAPALASITSTSPSTVELWFTANVRAASVVADGSQFLLVGTRATSAVAMGRRILLTTPAQTPAAILQLTNIEPSVTGLYDAPVTAGQTVFRGYTPSAVVAINELQPVEASNCDQLELRVLAGGAVDPLNLVTAAGISYNFPAGLIVSTNDYLILHIVPAGTEAVCNPTGVTSETLSKMQFPRIANARMYDNAYDFMVPTAVATSLRSTDDVLTIVVDSGHILDVLFMAKAITTAPMTDVAAANVLMVRQWLRAGGGVPPGGYVGAEFVLDAAGTDAIVTNDLVTRSLQRMSSTDTNTRTDWTDLGAATWGANNLGQNNIPP